MKGLWFLGFLFFLFSLVTPAPILGYSLFTLLGIYLFTLYLRPENEDSLEVSGDVTKGCGFPGERLLLRLKLRNKSKLPFFWLTVHQAFPVELGSIRAGHLTSLSSRRETCIEVCFFGAGRGIHPIPRINVEFGNPLSSKAQRLEFILDDQIVIYPEVSRVIGLDLLRRLPLGRQSIDFGLYEDPARLRGCREYIPGDRLKMIHWPNVAKTGQLQTKEWETTLDADIGVFLNLCEEDYPVESWSFLCERGIELAASVIHQLAGESVGFFANGSIPNARQEANVDCLSEGEQGYFQVLPKRGLGQEKKVLTYLAGVQLSPGRAGEGEDFTNLLQTAWRLTFGSALIIITPGIWGSVTRKIKKLRLMGYHPHLILLGRTKAHPVRAEQIGELKHGGIPVYCAEKGGVGKNVFRLSPRI